MNGNAVNLLLLIGEQRADIRHNTESIRQQNMILLDIKDAIEDLPSRLSTVISTEPSRKSSHIAEIIKACVPLLTIIGLMTGQIAWSDIWKIFGP